MSNRRFALINRGTSAGYLTETDADALYLRLDAANSPVTGTVEFQSGVRLTTNAITTTTPVGSSVPTMFDIPARTLGAYEQQFAVGILSGSNSSARVFSVFDARTGSHQPSIGVFSPDETDLFGFSWDGSNATASIKTVSAKNINIKLNEVVYFSVIPSDPSVNIVNASLRIYDNTVTYYGSIYHDGNELFNDLPDNTHDWVVSKAGTRYLSMVGTSRLDMYLGTDLRIYDGTNTGYANLDHDGTNFNSVFSTTTSWLINGLSSEMRLLGGASFTIEGGGGLYVWDGTTTDYAYFSHDGTDFNTVFSGTTSWNISGMTGVTVGHTAPLLYQRALTAVDTGGQQVAIAAESNSTSSTLIDIDNSNAAPTYGTGIRFNLAGSTVGYIGYRPDLSASANLSMAVGHSSSAHHTFYLQGSGYYCLQGGQIRAYDGTNTDYVQIFDDGSIAYLKSNNNPLYIGSNAGSVYLYNSAGTDFRIYEAAGADYARFIHDGTDFNTTFSGTGVWTIAGNVSVDNGYSGYLRVVDGGHSYVYDATNTQYIDYRLGQEGATDVAHLDYFRTIGEYAFKCKTRGYGQTRAGGLLDVETYNGSTWSSVSPSVTQELKFFAANHAANITIPNAVQKFRVTIINNGQYTYVSDFLMAISWSGNSGYVETVELRDYTAGTWSTHYTGSSSQTWSGWPGIGGVKFTTTSLYASGGYKDAIRITFVPTWSNGSNASIYHGGLWGSYPSGFIGGADALVNVPAMDYKLDFMNKYGGFKVQGSVADAEEAGTFGFMDVSGGATRFGSYDWDTATWKPVGIWGSTLTLNASGNNVTAKPGSGVFEVLGSGSTHYARVYDSSDTNYIQMYYSSGEGYVYTNTGAIVLYTDHAYAFKSGSNAMVSSYGSNGTSRIYMQHTTTHGYIYSTVGGILMQPASGSFVGVMAGRTHRVYDSTSTDYGQHSHDGTDFNLDFSNTTEYNINTVPLHLASGKLYITEQASEAGPGAGRGGVWVLNNAPNELWFTDDTGNDHHVAGGSLSEVFSVPKTSDETVTESTTLQNDDELVFPLQANATYWVKCYIKVMESFIIHSTGFKFTFTVPTGTTGYMKYIKWDTSGDTTPEQKFTTNWTTTHTWTSISSTATWIEVEGLLTTAGTSGNIQLQWACGTTSGGAPDDDTTVLTGSILTVIRAD